MLAFPNRQCTETTGFSWWQWPAARPHILNKQLRQDQSSGIMEFSKHILSFPAWIQSLIFSDVIWRRLEYQSACCKDMTEVTPVLRCWCCVSSHKCPFVKSVVWSCLFKSSVFIRLWYHSTVCLLCCICCFLNNVFLSSAGLLMTGVWSSPILETWPTLLKSSEVHSNVVHYTIEDNPQAWAHIFM